MVLSLISLCTLMIACGKENSDAFTGTWKGESHVVDSHYNSLIKKNMVTEVCSYFLEISKNTGGSNYTVKLTAVNNHPISNESRQETVMGSYAATRDGDTLLVDMGYLGKNPLKLENSKIIFPGTIYEKNLGVSECVFDKQLQK